MTLVFATNNKHKLQEVQALLENDIHIVSLNDIGCMEELPETGNTLEANAQQKAEYIYKKYQMNCFADDTGLEIESLNGKPGVYSACYAGKEQNDEKNIRKVLHEMNNHQNRNAQFRTVICLIINHSYHQFEGLVQGTILKERRGIGGFGYDSVFLPHGYKKTFAEMSMEEKNRISHRAIAIKKLVNFLNSMNN